MNKKNTQPKKPAPATKAKVPAKPKAESQPKAVEKPPATPPANKPHKLSGLDAAAKVLGEAGVAMTTREMIETMSAKGYWSSPGGLTPAATLYSALTRKINTKGDQARVLKEAPGRFSLRERPEA